MVTPSTFKEVLVHLDLKGAPPSLTYLKEILPILAYTGATSLLIEWEDTLPYSLGFDNTNPFRETEIFIILAAAESNGLASIPLVPLYSDMDFVLKVKEFAKMRQNFNDTRFICPNARSSLDLVFKMIGRVLDFHRDTKYFHIGFRGPFPQDECPRECCGGKHLYDVIIDHLVTIVRHFNQLYPQVKLLMWDDLFRCVPTSRIKQLMGIGKYVIPVVQPFEDMDILGYNVESYTEFLAAIFPEVWISGTYRSAPGNSHDFKLVPNLNQHLELNSRQVDFVEAFQHKFDHPITTFVLAGPQRDSHFSVLNELPPASLPSMCLASYCLRHKAVGYRGVAPLFRELRCPPIHPTDDGAYARCDFPGSDVYKIMMQLQTLVTSDEYQQLQDWKQSRYMQYNLRHRTLYSVSDVDEWMEQNILGLLLDIKTMKQSLVRMKKYWHWPKRQFPTNEELIREIVKRTRDS
ncbi:hypothetical protein M8J75_010184 [Diaphorina citri]|nr:hypothetical protein M8J75_010184 [Diaphorina citri]